MTYYNSTKILRDLALTSTDYAFGTTTWSTMITDWGDDADDEIDNMIALYTTVPLTTIPDIITTASNTQVRSRYHDFLHEEDLKKEWRERFEKIMAGYVERLRQGTLIIKSQKYKTFPLNPDATPYRSIPGGANSLDDSDL